MIEFLAAMSLFLVLLFFSYHAFDSQQQLLKKIIVRTEPEQESNYRLLLLKHFLERSSHRLKLDPLFEEVPVFFPDLSFGRTSEPNCFSIAHVTGSTVPFVRTGVNYKMASGAAVEEKKTYLMAGSDSAGQFGWNYAEAEKIWTIPDAMMAKFVPHTSGPELEKGKLIETEMHGFLYTDRTLYWISPSGTRQPYFSGLHSFEYIQDGPLLRLQWEIGQVKTEFQCEL